MLILHQDLLDKVEHRLREALSSGTQVSCKHVNTFFYLALYCVQRNLMPWYTLVIKLCEVASFFLFLFSRERISIYCSGWAQAISMPPSPPQEQELSTTRPQSRKSFWASFFFGGGRGGRCRIQGLTTQHCLSETFYVCPRTSDIPPPPCAGWVCRSTQVVVQVVACRPEVTFRRLPQLLSSLNRVSHLGPEFASSARLTSQRDLASLLSASLLLGLQVCCHTYLAFTWVLGLMWQVLCPLSHLSSPRHCYLIIIRFNEAHQQNISPRGRSIISNY